MSRRRIPASVGRIANGNRLLSAFRPGLHFPRKRLRQCYANAAHAVRAGRCPDVPAAGANPGSDRLPGDVTAGNVLDAFDVDTHREACRRPDLPQRRRDLPPGHGWDGEGWRTLRRSQGGPLGHLDDIGRMAFIERRAEHVGTKPPQVSEVPQEPSRAD